MSNADEHIKESLKELLKGHEKELPSLLDLLESSYEDNKNYLRDTYKNQVNYPRTKDSWASWAE